MAQFYVAGKAAYEPIARNKGLVTFLQEKGLFLAAVKKGLEKKVGSKWITVPLHYTPAQGDILRVKFGNLDTGSHPLINLVKEIAHATHASKSSRRVPKSSDRGSRIPSGS
jgi:hypothetical protein